MGEQKSAGHGSNTATQRRAFSPETQGMGDILVRAFLGQLTQPPETAVSVPHQQAISNAQMGPLGMSHVFGIGADRSLLPGANQAGLQSREQLGIPDRRSYFPFLPTPEQAQAAGAVPPVRADPFTRQREKRIGQLETRAGRAEERGNTKRATRLRTKEEQLKKSQPEKY